jgi:hypothetical protein
MESHSSVLGVQRGSQETRGEGGDRDREKEIQEETGEKQDQNRKKGRERRTEEKGTEGKRQRHGETSDKWGQS